MKIFINTMVIMTGVLALAGTAQAQDNFAGKWQGEFDSQIGRQKYTYEFKVDGTNLTGHAFGIRENGSNSVAITEGKINKDEISFVEPLKFNGTDIRIEYTGKISGNEIKLHREVGDFAEEDVVVKRVVAGEKSEPATNAPPAKP